MRDTIKRIASDPLGLMGLCLVVLMVVSALGAGLIAPYDPIQLNIMDRLQGPSASHLGRRSDACFVWFISPE